MRTVLPSVTPVCFGTMFTGVTPHVHGIECEKQRTVLPYRGRILEIDVYPFWKHTAVLEIELKTPDEIPEIPPQIIVLADVSQERRYSNHAMARHIPQEPV